jgi:hypothetical protein
MTASTTDEKSRADAVAFWGKVAVVSKEATRIPKRGWNDKQKYAYVRAVDVTETMREIIFAAGLAYSYDVIDAVVVGPTPTGSQIVTQVTTKHSYVDLDTGYERSFASSGQGADFGDKGTYKAQTGSEKYHLCKMFLLPTGDDPEEDSEGAPSGPAAPRSATQAAKASNSAPAMFEGDPGAHVVEFGKHKGTTIRALASDPETAGYVSWMANQDGDKPGFAAAKAFLAGVRAEHPAVSGATDGPPEYDDTDVPF